MIKKISEIISYIFNPFFISMTAFGLIIFGYIEPSSSRGLYAILVFLFIILIPLLILLFLKSHHEIETLEINRRDRRIKPLSFCILSYIVGFTLLTIFKAPYIVKAFAFCYILNTLIVLLITFSWKVSVHAIGVAGPLMALTFAFGPVMYPFYILLLIVGISRVILKRHTVLQVITGSLLGLVVTFIQLKYLSLVL